MAKSRKRKHRKGRKATGACKRVRVCGNLRTICRDRKGRIRSNKPAKRK